ncbi:hypothetical protein STEG23_017686, partial [Scotinomys teguina]
MYDSKLHLKEGHKLVKSLHFRKIFYTECSTFKRNHFALLKIYDLYLFIMTSNTVLNLVPIFISLLTVAPLVPKSITGTPGHTDVQCTDLKPEWNRDPLSFCFVSQIPAFMFFMFLLGSSFYHRLRPFHGLG